MNALLVLYGGNLSKHAFEPLFDGKSAFQMAFDRASQFPGVKKTVFFAPSTGDFSCPEGVQVEQRVSCEGSSWTKRTLLKRISELQEDFNLIYFVFADCPFLDPHLALPIAERHLKYAAEYSYADGWPYGLAPEIISPGTAGILANILGDNDGEVQRDLLFSVIQKDINAFDIETEISGVDLRCHRLSFSADSKRNLLLLGNFIDAQGGKIPSTSDVERIIAEKPQILRTLPSYYPIQVFGGCPQKCSICPYPLFTDSDHRKDFFEPAKFEQLLDKITAFSGNAVIGMSLWGELSLHPEKMKLIEAVVSRRELSLVIETSGIGWKAEELEKCAYFCSSHEKSKENLSPPLSWIVSLDTRDPQKYSQIRGEGFAQAENCAKKLFSLFPKDCYVQAVRTCGSEDDTEKFYRYWKDASPNREKNIIIQKYDDFCNVLERKQASDISPVIRKPCWHIMRDMPVLIDGTVPLCREELILLKEHKEDNSRCLGNVFTDSLETIWKNGERFFSGHCIKNYTEKCINCDEYYTYNF